MPRQKPSQGPLRAVIYRRASLDATGEKLAVDRQLDLSQALCDMRGYVVVGVKTDNSVSAYKRKKRPGWEEVLEMIRNHEVDIVVAYHLDRITRSMADLVELCDLAKEAGVGVATVTGDYDLTGDTGRMVASILGAVAVAEVERKGTRQRDANEQRATAGRPWSGGARPFGYAKDQLTIVEAEAEAIRQAAQDALAGTSMREIARRWDAAGLRSSRASENTKAGWTGRGVKNVLVSPRYAGIRQYRGEEVGPGTWPAIFDLETHMALKSKLTEPSRLKHHHRAGRTPTNLLSGIAKCGVCDGRVNGSANKGTKTYTCRPNGHVCPSRDLADKWVVATVLSRLSAPDALALLTPTGNSNVDAARAELDAKRAQLADLDDDYAEGVVDRVRWRALSKTFNAKIEELESILINAGNVRDLSGLAVGTAEIIDQWDTFDIPKQRRLIESLVDVTVLQASTGGRGETGVWDPAVHLLIKFKQPGGTDS